MQRILSIFYFLLATTVSWAEEQVHELCQSPEIQMQRLSYNLQNNIALVSSVQKLRTLENHCRIPLSSIQMTQEDLNRLLQKGLNDRYRHSLELRRHGIGVDFSVVEREGRTLHKPFARIQQDWALALQEGSRIHARRRPPRLSSECSPVDLREELPPQRHQGALSWCQSMVVADLLSHALQTPLSAARIGYIYSQSRLRENPEIFGDRFFLEDGSIEGVFGALRKRPHLCSEEELPSLQPRSKMETLIAFYLRSQDPSALSLELSSIEKTALSLLFPALSANELSAAIQKSHPSHFFESLSQKACQHPQKLPSSWRLQRRDDDHLGLLDQLLNQGTVGAIFYDQSFLFDPRISSTVPNHVSSIVGRRWNHRLNRCEYLLRNSYGTSCQYSAHFDCQGGNLWIPDDYLDLTIKSVYWLSTSGPSLEAP